MSDVEIKYTVNMLSNGDAIDVYGPAGQANRIYKGTLAMPYSYGDGSGAHIDFITQPVYSYAAGFFDVAWWQISTASIDTADNLFLDMRYQRTATDHSAGGVVIPHLMKKGDCYDDTPPGQSFSVTMHFCYLGLVAANATAQ